MNIESILAVTNFSTTAEHGLERAALIAVKHQAKLRIIYGAEVFNPGLADPSARLRQRGRQLARRHSIKVEVLEHIENMLDDLVNHARSANLLVLDHRRHRTMQTLWRGTTLDQLLRRCRCPILVVKQIPCERYERVLVAVDFTVESEKLVRYASSLDAESELELFHSFEALDKAGLRANEGSQQVITAYRRMAGQGAADRSLRMSEFFGVRRNRVTSLVGRSDSAREIAVHQSFIHSDLVIVGNRRRSAFVDFLSGNVAKRLMDWVDSDIVVFPHDYQAPTSAVAKERLQTPLCKLRSL